MLDKAEVNYGLLLFSWLAASKNVLSSSDE